MFRRPNSNLHSIIGIKDVLRVVKVHESQLALCGSILEVPYLSNKDDQAVDVVGLQFSNFQFKELKLCI